MTRVRLHRLVPIFALAAAADAMPQRPQPVHATPGPPTWGDDLHILRALSQAEGLLRVGHAAEAAQLLADLAGGTHTESLTRVRAWALFAAGRYADVTRVVDSAQDHGDELAFLRAAAQARLGRRDGSAALRGLWWEAPEGVWGLGALRELATLGLYSPRERRLILAHVAPVSFDAPQSPPKTHLFATLAREAPRSGYLAAEARAALGAHLLRAENFTTAAAALREARARAPAAGLRRLITLRLGEAERRRGSYEAAQHHFTEVAAGGNDRWVATANALAGQMAIEFRRYPDARRHFEAQLVHNPVGPARHEALWGLGFVAFRSGDFRAALRFFAALHAEAPYGPLSPRSLYWGARAREELGDVIGAATLMAAVVQHFPVDYYAYRAEVWLAGTDVTAGAMTIAAPSDPTLARALSLAQAGMRKRAVAALAQIDPAALSPEGLTQLEQVSLQIGADELATQFRTARARRFPDRATSSLVAAAFPFTYRPLLADEARRYHLDPALLAGLIRQESGFRADAVSPVGALGLMQLMPATARLLYKEEGRRAPSHAELVDPHTNVHLGSRYLGRMLRAFNRRLEYALAAYNAGPGAVTRWRQARGDLPVDIFVEEIPYAETRHYVERVLAGARAYTWLTRREATAGQAQARLP